MNCAQYLTATLKVVQLYPLCTFRLNIGSFQGSIILAILGSQSSCDCFQLCSSPSSLAQAEDSGERMSQSFTLHQGFETLKKQREIFLSASGFPYKV